MNRPDTTPAVLVAIAVVLFALVIAYLVTQPHIPPGRAITVDADGTTRD